MSSQKICPQCGTEYPVDQLFCPKDGSTLKLLGGTGDLIGAIIHKSYHVKQKLGEGGMGTVYLAEHVKMGRKSAVKVMNPGMVNDPDAISRFNREAANASKINHPNVAAVYDFGETEDGLIFLAMEFIEGPSLTKVIAQAGALTPLRAADIARQASEALAVAHDMGIVHRDLKPDNIMLATGRDGADVVKVVDFGIAKAAKDEGQKVTKTGLVVGTPEYMSPEQLAGDVLDGRSDTYSLALVAFNMLTGKLPFPGETSQETMIARLTDEPKRLGEMKPDVPWSEDVQAVMDRALARSAADRYQSAAEFGRALFAAVQAMPGIAELTSAHTAVIAPPAAVPKTAVASKAAVPPTRVGVATPAAAPARSPTPLVAGIGGGALLAVAAVAYFAMKGGGATDPDSASGAAASQLNRPLTAPAAAPVINVPRELEEIGAMDSGDSAQAQAMLGRLGVLDSAARGEPDSTFVQYRFLRTKALLGIGDVTGGCDSLKNIEGRLKGTRFERSGANLLAVCRQQ